MRPAEQPRYRSEILRRVTLPGLVVDVCRMEFDALDGTPLPIFDDQHVFGLSLSPQPGNSAGRYAAAPTMDFVPSGAITFKPAGLSVLARNDGGVQTVLRCRFADTRLRAILGTPLKWRPRDLAACLDVTADGVGSGLRRLAHEVDRTGPPDRAAIESAATLLLIDFARSLALPACANHLRGGLTPLQISRLRFRIKDAAQPVARVSELAGLLGMSERHLLRGFRTSAGTSLRDHLQDVSSGRACDWLADGDMPVKLIAQRLGYSSPAGFSAAFARRLGETPSAFRRRHRGRRDV